MASPKIIPRIIPPPAVSPRLFILPPQADGLLNRPDMILDEERCARGWINALRSSQNWNEVPAPTFAGQLVDVASSTRHSDQSV
jgi:hypothetical protein